MDKKKKKIGLIIGSGQLAIYCIEQLIFKGYNPTIIRLPCSTIKLEKSVDSFQMKFEEINDMFSFLKKRNIKELALIGYMQRPKIDVSEISFESKRILLEVLPLLSKGDGVIFNAVSQMIVRQGFNLIKVQDLLPELTMPSGRYGSFFNEREYLEDLNFGLILFQSYSKLDVGQSLIFQKGHCLGMETITGTNEMINAVINYRTFKKRVLNENSSGGILIKGSKPHQTLDIDTPVIGPDTIQLAKKAKLSGLVIESDTVILVNKELIIKLLKRYNMFLIAKTFE